MRDKLILGGFETWVEYDARLCCVNLFGFETAKIPLTLDVMGMKGHRHVNGFIYNTTQFGQGGHASLTEQEKKELNYYIHNLEVTN